MYFSLLKKSILVPMYILLLFSVFFMYMTLVHIRDSIVLIIIVWLILLPSFLLLAWNLFFGVYSGRFYIDENGVKYIRYKRKYSLKWEEIHDIRIAGDSRGFISKNSPICFDGRDVDQSHLSEIRDQKEYHELYFGVQYRKRIMKEVRKYWDKQIQGIYHVEGKGRL